MPIDYSRYHDRWLTEIRPRILSRAGNCCEGCGVPNRASIVRLGETWRLVEGLEAEVDHLDGLHVTHVVLTVAHLDHDVANNSDANLKAYCQRCHLRHDAYHHARNAAETRRRKRAAMGQASLPMEVGS